MNPQILFEANDMFAQWEAVGDHQAGDDLRDGYGAVKAKVGVVSIAVGIVAVPLGDIVIKRFGFFRAKLRHKTIADLLHIQKRYFQRLGQLAHGVRICAVGHLQPSVFIKMPARQAGEQHGLCAGAAGGLNKDGKVF